MDCNYDVLCRSIAFFRMIASQEWQNNLVAENGKKQKQLGQETGQRNITALFYSTIFFCRSGTCLRTADRDGAVPNEFFMPAVQS